MTDTYYTSFERCSQCVGSGLFPTPGYWQTVLTNQCGCCGGSGSVPVLRATAGHTFASSPATGSTL